jgi:cellulose synthase operon protein C
MSLHRLILPGIVILLSVTATLACGPFFPWQLLDNRAATLKETPANSFAFEAAHLESPSTDRLKALEGAPSTGSEEATEVSAGQLASIATMRSSKSGDEAFAKGAVLSAGLRLYTAGAVDFKLGQFAPARARFQAVLFLPDVEKRTRATWAAYMLGRSHAAEGDTEKAAQAFKLTRELAVEGAPDPLGLAVASYGEEARLYLRRAKSYLNGNNVPPQASQQYSHDIANAVALYARQAADGSTSGVLSLRFVARDLLGCSSKIRSSVSDALVQRLLVAYVLANFNDAPAWRAAWVVSEPYHPPEPEPILGWLLEGIEANGVDHPADADRLAALAYRVGRYDLAQKLAQKATGPLAAWIKAKLALQRGDVAAAAASYAEASKAFPPAGFRSTTLDESNEALLLGENGILTLARGEYVEALAQLYPMAETYWGDIAYIAERVLTVDELRRFVDAGFAVATPTPSPPGRPRLIGLPEPVPPGITPPVTNWLAPDPSSSLRDLLARRLVRVGRFEEAIRYFGGQSTVGQRVEEYRRDLHDATQRWWAADRARAWFEAALLARSFGMQMMGYEGPPDYFATDGGFDGGLGHVDLGKEFVSQGERARFEASAAEPDFRFHYRYIAVQEASRAADLLPPRSQAFAAVLCHATGWMIDTQAVVHRPGVDGRSASRELVHQLYHRYLNQGPYVPWATHFGHTCPDPDFDAAARFTRTQLLKKARHLARHYQSLIAAMLFVGVLGFVISRRNTGRRLS